MLTIIFFNVSHIINIFDITISIFDIRLFSFREIQVCTSSLESSRGIRWLANWCSRVIIHHCFPAALLPSSPSIFHSFDPKLLQHLFRKFPRWEPLRSCKLRRVAKRRRKRPAESAVRRLGMEEKRKQRARRVVREKECPARWRKH